MKDNIINFEDKKKQGIADILEEAVNKIFETLIPQTKEDAKNIKNPKLNIVCNEYILAVEKVLQVIEEDNELTKYEEKDRSSFIAALNMFSIKVKEKTGELIKKDIYSILEKEN